MVAVASVVLAVALFLDWLSLSCSAPSCGAARAGASGYNDWGVLTVLALLAVGRLLLVRRFLAEIVGLPMPPAPDPGLYIAGGALEVVGCLLFWVEYHDSFGAYGVGAARYSFGLGSGWWLALAAGAATVAGGLLMERAPKLAAAVRRAPPGPVPPC